MNNKKPNLSKAGKFIARKFLKHHSEDIANFDQDLIIDSLGKHMDQIQKTKRWWLAIVLILIWSVISKSISVNIFGLDIPIKKIIYFACPSLIFVNVSLTIWFIRIGKLVLLLDGRDNFIKGLSKLSTHTLIFNPFAFCGSKNNSPIWMGVNIGGLVVLLILLLILAIYSGYSGVQKPILLLFCSIVMLPGVLVIGEILDIISFKLDAKNKSSLNK